MEIKPNFLEMKIEDFHMKNHLQNKKKVKAILLKLYINIIIFKII